MNIVKWLVSLAVVSASSTFAVSTENSQFLAGPVEPSFGTEIAEFAKIEGLKRKDDTTYVFEEVASVAARIGARGDINPYKIHRIIYCESGYRNVQSNVVKNGVREDSWGVAQIHLPSHPNITKQQALDVNFAVEFVAREVLAGNTWKWYGYNPQLDRCNR